MHYTLCFGPGHRGYRVLQATGLAIIAGLSAIESLLDWEEVYGYSVRASGRVPSSGALAGNFRSGEGLTVGPGTRRAGRSAGVTSVGPQRGRTDRRGPPGTVGAGQF